jgi:3-oxoacyl-[acyl-carrier protein] reductase
VANTDVETVIVTGANGEIGRSICKKIMLSGRDVVAITRSATDFSEIKQTESSIQNVVVPDIADLVAIGKVFANLNAKGVNLGGLVSGAAIFNRFESLDEMTTERWAEIFRINVIAPFLWAKTYAAWCEIYESSGSIINIASQAAFTGGFGGVIPYAASKGALISTTKGLARELAPKNIRVNSIAPGFIETEAMNGNLDTEKLKAFYLRVPMGRFGTVDEVADVVVFLLSEASNYITGSTIDITGGQLMH